jgi:cobalt-zinc-cadmium efflux system protein
MHDLHIRALSTKSTGLSVHLVCASDRIDDERSARVARELKAKFAIEHATIQFETGDGAPRALEPEHVV